MMDEAAKPVLVLMLAGVDVSPNDAWLPVLGFALAAGVVSALATVAVERFGGRVGGILGTVPTTIMPATMGLFATHPMGADGTASDGFLRAVAVVPAGMMLNAAFLASWRVLPRWLHADDSKSTLWRCVAASLAVWAVLSLAWVVGMHAMQPSTGVLLAIGVGTLLATAALGIVLCRHGVPAPKGTNHVMWPVLVARGVAAGSAIAMALVIAQGGHAIAGGMAVTFPAIFLTTIVGTWLAQGREVPVGAVGPMVLGSCAVGSYAMLAGVLYPRLGLWIGTPVCWVLAVGCVSVPAGLWLRAHSMRADQE
ncbi:MAG: hypothetical protein FJ254_08625 [Phycisphaerae bacterium]|nr:hypothetical protein [Phycisphaerae bacterium]